MYIQQINLVNFRNYTNILINFSPNINIIYGKNAQGKTNLLESIYVLGFAKPHRLFQDDQLIKDTNSFARIDGIIVDNKISNNLEITIQHDKKKFKKNSISINKLRDYISYLKVVVFSPEDLELIKGTPLIRRKFLNTEIGQFHNGYLKVLSDYNKIVKLRNQYFKDRSSNKIDYNYLESINNVFIEKAIILYRMRKKWLSQIELLIRDMYKELSNSENFHIRYKTDLPDHIENRNEIFEFLKKELINNLEKDLILKTTSVGPHHDDIEFYLQEKNMKYYGSQGQQRLAVLALKLSEIALFNKYNNISPIVLLDDVFSELDFEKRNNLLKTLSKNMQVIITTTDLNIIDKKIINKAKLIPIENGELKKEDEVDINE